MVIAVGGAGLYAFLTLAGSARPEPATFALLLAGAALVLSLRALHRLVTALARPDVRTLVARVDQVGAAGRRALRDEKRMVLRAIKELDFDRAMGKISEADYDQVRAGYRLRAVEVMRALDEAPELHPELLRELETRTGSGGEAPPTADTDDAAPPVDGDGEAPEEAERICEACGGSNDVDAKFCKHCGKELAA